MKPRLLPALTLGAAIFTSTLGCCPDKDKKKETQALPEPNKTVLVATPEVKRAEPILVAKLEVKDEPVLAATPEVKKTNDVKVAEAPQAPSPKLLTPYYLDKDGKLAIPNGAIEFHVDNATPTSRIVSESHRIGEAGSITESQMDGVIKWFRRVANLKETPIKEREAFLDAAAGLSNKYKKGIPMPLPKVLLKADLDGNGQIDVSEAFNFYKARTGNDVEKNGNGQVTPGSFRRVIEAFNDAFYTSKDSSLNIRTHLARNECLYISWLLISEYEKLYGPYEIPDPLIYRR